MGSPSILCPNTAPPSPYFKVHDLLVALQISKAYAESPQGGTRFRRTERSTLDDDCCHWKEVDAQTVFPKTTERNWFEVKRQTNLLLPSHAELAPSLKRYVDEAWEESEAKRTALDQPAVIGRTCA